MPRATSTVGLTHPDHGQRVVVRKNEERDAKDPLVKAHPWAFASASGSGVEQATAAPGEKRTGTRRPRKKTGAKKKTGK